MAYQEEIEYKFKVADRVSYNKNLTGKIGCIHNGLAYMTECQCNMTGTIFKYGDGGCCEEHKNFMGYSLEKLKKIPDNQFRYTILEDEYSPIGTIDMGYQEPLQVKKQNKFMSVIKDIFKSKENRALSNYGITNGDGGLTTSGREEFIDFLWETMTEQRKDFTSKVVEKFDEDKK